jgi:hypothetical protein
VVDFGGGAGESGGRPGGKSIHLFWAEVVMLGFCARVVAVGCLVGVAVGVGAAEPVKLEQKVEELIKRVEERAEARAVVWRAEAEVARIESAVEGGGGEPIARDEYQLQQMELERDMMKEQKGSENPMYKAYAERVRRMQENYAQKFARWKEQVTAALASARRELEAARGRLEAASGKVEGVKREVLEWGKGR